MPFPAQIARGRLGGDSRPVGVRHYQPPTPPLIPGLRLPLFTGTTNPRALRADWKAAIDLTAGFTIVAVIRWAAPATPGFHNMIFSYGAPATLGIGGFQLQCPWHDQWRCVALNASYLSAGVVINREALNDATQNDIFFDGATHIIMGGVNPAGQGAFDDIPDGVIWVSMDTPAVVATDAFAGSSVYTVPAQHRPLVIGFDWDQSTYPWNGGAWCFLLPGQFSLARRTQIFNAGKLAAFGSTPVLGPALWLDDTAVTGTRADRSANAFSFVEYNAATFAPSLNLVGSEVV